MLCSFPLLMLKRKLIKKYIKLTHPREQRYKADYWPDVKVEQGIVYFQGKSVETKKFSDLQVHSDDINIIGSGPSVNYLDYRKLLESTFNIFLNGSISLAYRHNLPIYAYVIMDANFVYNRFDLITQIGKGKKLVLSLGALCAIAERDYSIISENEVYVFHQKKLVESDTFSRNADEYVVDGGTVMSIAIQCFNHIASGHIYLLGMDISNASTPRFYENANDMQKSGLQKDYEDKILPFMAEAAKCFDGRILNCSPISKLPFDIIPYSKKYEKS